MVGQFTVGPDAAQVGYVEFETTVATHLTLSPSLSEILSTLDNAPGVGRGTYLSGGIDAGQAVLAGAGARTGVPKVMVLMTDGKQTVH